MHQKKRRRNKPIMYNMKFCLLFKKNDENFTNQERKIEKSKNEKKATLNLKNKNVLYKKNTDKMFFYINR